MDKNFKNGDIVTIINSTIGGKAIVEGKAFVVRYTGLSDDHYTVRFVNDIFQEEYDRFVNPAAQGNPNAFVAELNKGLGK